MASSDSRVTIHMAASLDGFIARKDGSTSWLETSDEFAGGADMDPAFVEAFLKTIDCYVMGSRTYETALKFAAKGLGWVYGDKPTFVLTSRVLPRVRETVEFYSGDLAELVNGRLRPQFRSIWVVGGGTVCGHCLALGLADEVRWSILPILIGDGIQFFERIGHDVALHLTEVKAYKNGMVELCYEVPKAVMGSVDRSDATQPARRPMEVEPGMGIGPFRLGMSSGQVAAVCQETGLKNGAIGETGLSIEFVADKAVRIQISPDFGLSLAGIPLEDPSDENVAGWLATIPGRRSRWEAEGVAAFHWESSDRYISVFMVYSPGHR